MGPTDYAGIVTYTIILIYYVVALKSAAEIGKFKDGNSVPEHIRVLGQFKYHFFTIWNFILQIIFLLTAISDEISKLLDLPLALRKQLGRARAFLFNSLVFPCSFVVVTVFWTLWHIDRELIFPRDIDPIFPPWLNHTMHTVVFVTCLIELALPKKYNFVRSKNAAAVLTIYATTYQLLYFSVYLRYGVWLYPIYTSLNWTQRILFSLFQLFLCIVYQRIGIAVQNTKKTQTRGKLA